MKKRTAIAGIVVLILGLGALTASAADAEAWREDLTAMVAHIEKHHPDPFRDISPEEFAAEVAALDERIPELPDKAIIVEMARLVAMIGDGHTRLALPRLEPSRGLSLAHTTDPPPARDSLRFASLPIRFGLFDDGLFVTAASRDYEDLLGARVGTIGKMSTDEAIERVREIGYFDNAQGAKLMAVDRLALPGVLFHLGISEKTDRVVLGIERPGAEPALREVRARHGESAALESSARADGALWLRRSGDTGYVVSLPDAGAVYLQLNRIAPPEGIPYADFLREAIRAAGELRSGRLILDLRHNHGGNAMWNAAIVDALARSRLNEYGRILVLIGRGTFSAAQMLLGALEQYVNVVFVGEASGSSPSHFGDPVKTQLPHSGLTLRVSTIAWRSWLAGEFREATSPHLPVRYESSDYFGGRDPVLDAALAYEPPADIARQVEDLLRRGQVQNAAIRYLRFHTDTAEYPHAALDDVLAAGHRLLDEGLTREGFYVMALAVGIHPESAAAHAGEGRAFELRGERDSAAERYRAALELEPGNELAKAGLMRLEKTTQRPLPDGQ